MPFLLVRMASLASGRPDWLDNLDLGNLKLFSLFSSNWSRGESDYDLGTLGVYIIMNQPYISHIYKYRLKTYKRWKSVDYILIYMSRLMQGLFDFSLSSTARHLRRGRHGICNALHGWKHPHGGHRWICCPSVLNESPGWCTEKKHLVIIWFFKCQTKKWRIENTQPLNNLCKSCIYCGFKFPLETSKLPTTFPWKLPNFPQLFSAFFVPRFGFMGPPNIATGHLTIVETLRLSWVPSSHESLWKYTIPSFWGMIWWSTVVVLFWYVTCVGVGILVKMRKKHFILMQALELWIIPQSCRQSGLWACFMLFRKVATFLIAGNDISPISNNQRMVLRETMQTKCTTHTLSVISKI